MRSSESLHRPLQEHSTESETPVCKWTFAARLKRLLKKSEKQIPRGLESVRDDKNKGLYAALKRCSTRTRAEPHLK